MPGTDSFIPKLFQGVERESTAFKMMKSMGWDEGRGLGKDNQGIATHVRVSKKFDNAGLGIAEERKNASNWTVNTVVFDNILKNLNVKIANSVPKKVDSVKSSSDSDSESDSGSDSESDSESEENEGTISEKVQKIVRPQGRYKRREAGKSVKSYSDTDLAAILGSNQPSSSSPANHLILPSSSPSVKTNVMDKPSPSPSPLAMEAPVPNTRPLSIDDRSELISQPDLSQTIPNKPTPTNATPWWGDKYGFVRAGQLGSGMNPNQSQAKPSDSITAGKNIPSSSPPNPNPRASFNEQDQEDLYHLVQNNATSGRRGLGVGDLTQKKLKSDWKGSKVKFDDDEDDDNNNGGVEEGGVRHDDGIEKIIKDAEVGLEGIVEKEMEEEKKRDKKKRKRETSKEEGEEEEENESSKMMGDQVFNKLKLKKFASKALKKAPNNKLSMKKLKKEVFAMAFEALNDGTLSKQQISSSLLNTLEKSSKFSIEGKYVKCLS